jgi:outer membrane protein assembly factor BamB
VGSQQVIEQKKSAIELWKRDIPGQLTSMDLSPEHHWVALGFEDGGVHFLDEEGKLVWEAEVGQPVKGVKILARKKKVAILNEYSQLFLVDFAGKLALKKGFKEFWSGLHSKSGDVLLSGWKSKPRRVDVKGRTVRDYPIPQPWIRVVPVPKKDQFWVVHNQVCLGLYQSDGTNLWLINNPSPLELSRGFSSEFAISDTGDVFAITCFDKGVYLYNGINQTLSQIDLDRPVAHVDVSGNGKFLLLADQLGKIMLASKSAAVVWEKELLSAVTHCRIDRRGSRVVVAEKNGTLTCFKFLEKGEKRSNFLELTQFHDLGDHKEIWSQPVHKVSPSPATVNISDDGRFVLLGDGKEFQLYDASGSLVWIKHLMTRLPNVRISRTGRKVLLSSNTELFLLDTHTLKEKHLTFYNAELSEVALAPSGTAVLVFDKFKTLTCYSGKGKEVWSRNLKKEIYNLRVHNLASRAVFQASPKILFVLDLKSLRLKKTVLGGAVTALELTQDGIFTGGKMGRCYGLDLNGKEQWQHKMEGPIQEIIPLKKKVLFRNKQGDVLLCSHDGRKLGEVTARSSYSLFGQHKKDILELVPSGDMLSCYKVPAGDLVWRLPLVGGIQSIAVSETANRMAILDSQSFHYHQLVHEPHAVEDRSSFLEL